MLEVKNNDKVGTLYGVSVGTGDPDLITIKALKILQSTRIIAFPAGINGKQGVAETIIQQYLQPHQHKLSLSFPYTLSSETLFQAWYSVSVEIWQYLQQGENVAFACEGDISFYSTFTYVAFTLKKIYPAIKIQRISGVSSPMAAASVLNLPLTMQQEKLVVLPALYSLKNLEDALDFSEVVVLMKVASVYEKVWEILAKRNLFKNAYLVEKATNNQEKIYSNLENYPQLKLHYFSILIIRQSHDFIWQ